jgi:calcineurin-like phosphoesterase family protein
MRLNIDLTQGKVKPNVFFTSDFHLFHKNVLKFDKRPFNDVQEMHQVIEERWNETVNDNDYVIYLGDLAFARREEKVEVEGMLWRLKGKIHFVMGNHDKWEEIKKLPRLESVQDYLEVRIATMEENKSGALERKETLFTCMHYPIFSHNKAHHGSYHVHGHTHGNLHHGEDANYYVNRRAIDAGCMLHDYRPISYLDVIEKLKEVQLPTLEPREL